MATAVSSFATIASGNTKVTKTILGLLPRFLENSGNLAIYKGRRGVINAYFPDNSRVSCH